MKYLIISLLSFILFVNFGFAQETKYKRSSIRTGIGLGVNDGNSEMGIGLLYSVGWQKSFGKKNKLRINPNLTYGGFFPIIVTDVRDQFYRITNLGMNFHYDLLKVEAVSIVTTIGGFGNYSRGLLGTGGEPEMNRIGSEYLFDFYFGGVGSIGLRIDPKNRNRAFEIRPINIYFGNDGFYLLSFMIGIDFKLYDRN